MMDRSEQPRCVVVWDSLYQAVLVRNWFTNQFEVVYLSYTYRIFFFSLEMPTGLFCRQWNRPDIEVRSIHGWIWYTRRGSISPPMHICSVFLCLQYSIHSLFLVYFCIFLFKLNLFLHCSTVLQCTVLNI